MVEITKNCKVLVGLIFSTICSEKENGGGEWRVERSCRCNEADDKTEIGGPIKLASFHFNFALCVFFFTAAYNYNKYFFQATYSINLEF